MNELELINKYYIISTTLLKLYMTAISYDKDAVKLLDLSKLYVDKARDIKTKFDLSNPAFEEEINDLEKKIEDQNE